MIGRPVMSSTQRCGPSPGTSMVYFITFSSDRRLAELNPTLWGRWAKCCRSGGRGLRGGGHGLAELVQGLLGLVAGGDDVTAVLLDGVRHGGDAQSCDGR